MMHDRLNGHILFARYKAIKIEDAQMIDATKECDVKNMCVFNKASGKYSN